MWSVDANQVIDRSRQGLEHFAWANTRAGWYSRTMSAV